MRIASAARVRRAWAPPFPGPPAGRSCALPEGGAARRDDLGPADSEARATVHEAVDLLDSGEGRVAEWAGEPNGLKFLNDRELIVADYRGLTNADNSTTTASFLMAEAPA